MRSEIFLINFIKVVWLTLTRPHPLAITLCSMYLNIIPEFLLLPWGGCPCKIILCNRMPLCLGVVLSSCLFTWLNLLKPYLSLWEQGFKLWENVNGFSHGGTKTNLQFQVSVNFGLTNTFSLVSAFLVPFIKKWLRMVIGAFL